MTRTSIFKTFIVSMLLAAPAAQAAVLDFESFLPGQIIDTEYQPLVTISAVNNDAPGPNNDVPNWAVIYDTTAAGRDPDLRSPFYQSLADLNAEIGNPGDANFQPGPNPKFPGNVLIIQENNVGCEAANSTICSKPDDEGDRPAGHFSFDFSGVIELISIEFFDIENPENGTTAFNKIEIWDGNDNYVGVVGHTPDTGGDRLWDIVVFDQNDPRLKNVGRVDVYMRGSGALDNLTYSVVPLPASIWLFGAALLGFIGYSRRISV